MLFSRKLFVTLLAAVVVSAEKREKIPGAVRFYDFEGNHAEGDIMTETCYDFKDGLFGQNLGFFNDNISFFTPLHAIYHCLLFEHWGCWGNDVQVRYPGSDSIGALEGIASAFQCHTYKV